jgi:hypothetical protein
VGRSVQVLEGDEEAPLLLGGTGVAGTLLLSPIMVLMLVVVPDGSAATPWMLEALM